MLGGFPSPRSGTRTVSRFELLPLVHGAVGFDPVLHPFSAADRGEQLVVSEESHALAWLRLGELAESGESIVRMVRKTAELAGEQRS